MTLAALTHTANLNLTFTADFIKTEAICCVQQLFLIKIEITIKNLQCLFVGLYNCCYYTSMSIQ